MNILVQQHKIQIFCDEGIYTFIRETHPCDKNLHIQKLLIKNPSETRK